MKIKVFLVLIAINIYLNAQTDHKYLDFFFSALALNNHFNGNVLIAEHGKIIYEKSFGFADFESQRINTNSSRFPIASIINNYRLFKK